MTVAEGVREERSGLVRCVCEQRRGAAGARRSEAKRGVVSEAAGERRDVCAGERRDVCAKERKELSEEKNRIESETIGQ